MVLNTKTRRGVTGSVKTTTRSMADAVAYADRYLMRKYEVTWDDLGDIVMYNDFPELTNEQIIARCEEKVEKVKWCF